MATVLIVQDDPAVGRLLDLALSVEGHDTEVVVNGADYYLTKPFELADLRAIIERLLSASAATDAAVPARRPVAACVRSGSAGLLAADADV